MNPDWTDDCVCRAFIEEDRPHIKIAGFYSNKHSSWKKTIWFLVYVVLAAVFGYIVGLYLKMSEEKHDLQCM